MGNVLNRNANREDHNTYSSSGCSGGFGLPASYSANSEVGCHVRVRDRTIALSLPKFQPIQWRLFAALSHKHFPEGTRPMADNSLPATSSSSTGGLSFAQDPRAFYNKETGTWRLEDDDGNEFEYDQPKGAWVPLVCNLSPQIWTIFLRVNSAEGMVLIRSGLAPG